MKRGKLSWAAGNVAQMLLKGQSTCRLTQGQLEWLTGVLRREGWGTMYSGGYMFNDENHIYKLKGNSLYIHARVIK